MVPNAHHPIQDADRCACIKAGTCQAAQTAPMETAGPEPSEARLQRLKRKTRPAQFLAQSAHEKDSGQGHRGKDRYLRVGHARSAEAQAEERGRTDRRRDQQNGKPPCRRPDPPDVEGSRQNCLRGCRAPAPPTQGESGDGRADEGQGRRRQTRKELRSACRTGRPERNCKDEGQREEDHRIPNAQGALQRLLTVVDVNRRHDSGLRPADGRDPQSVALPDCHFLEAGPRAAMGRTWSRTSRL